MRTPLIYLRINNGVEYQKSNVDYNYLRTTEKQIYTYENSAVSVFDLRADTELNAILGILRTFFVSVVLTAGYNYIYLLKIK